MKKVFMILAAFFLVTMMCVINVQADTWLLGTSNVTTLTYDSTTFAMPATTFNYSLITDFHMWYPGYTGPYAYNSSHKFQSSANAFDLTINSAGGVYAYDRGDTSNTTVLTSTDQYWAITLKTHLDTHIRGLSAEGLNLSGDHITGYLVSDGIFHWYGNFPDTTMASQDYFSKFYFDFTTNSSSGNLYTGTMQIYATNTPLPGTLLLLGSGLIGLGLLGRRKLFNR